MRRSASVGFQTVRTSASSGPNCPIALFPRNGMLPWATAPRATTRNQYTPRCPTETRPEPNGSGITTTVPLGNRPDCASQPTPACPPISSSTVPEISRTPPRRSPARRIASAAKRAAARPPFMSLAPRPQTDPSRISPENGSPVHPSPAGTTSKCPFR